MKCSKCKTELTYNETLFQPKLCKQCYEEKYPEDKEDLEIDDETKDYCILCGKAFMIGVDGNELGFCLDCQNKPDFPYDLDAYYKDYDADKVVFKGFETMSRGLLEQYRRNKK